MQYSRGACLSSSALIGECIAVSVVPCAGYDNVLKHLFCSVYMVQDKTF